MSSLMTQPGILTPSIRGRRALKKLGIGLTAIALDSFEARVSARQSDFVPAVVIGRGFGGAVAAFRFGAPQIFSKFQ